MVPLALSLSTLNFSTFYHVIENDSENICAREKINEFRYIQQTLYLEA